MKKNATFNIETESQDGKKSKKRKIDLEKIQDQRQPCLTRMEAI